MKIANGFDPNLSDSYSMNLMNCSVLIDFGFRLYNSNPTSSLIAAIRA